MIEMVNTLVTGATGLIGSHMVEYLTENTDDKIFSLAHNYCQSEFLVEKLWNVQDILVCDLVDTVKIAGIIQENNIKKIYHFAAQAIVKTSEEWLLPTFITNIVGTANIIDASIRFKVDKVLNMSTDKVYGQPDKLPITIKSPYKSSGAYANSKIAQEMVCFAAINEHNLNVVIPRCCNIFGYDIHSRIIPNTIRKIIKGQKPWVFQDEKGIRQYIHISELCPILYELMEGNYQGPYNIHTDYIYGQEDVVKKCVEIAKSSYNIDVEIEYKPKPEHDKRLIDEQYMAIDKRIKRQETGKSFDDYIDLTFYDFRKYEDDWK